MDVRSVTDIEPQVEHNGTVPVWYFVHPRELMEETSGGYLELANQFAVAVGAEVYPHEHPTHEWYFMLEGQGVMKIAGEERPVAPGDFIYIPPNTVHSLRTTGDVPIRSFCFAIAIPGAGEIDYTTH
jgi:mannose-6-phosphate isomerase-like protein (cupin superfamily)